jgi:hypothetical protein
VASPPARNRDSVDAQRLGQTNQVTQDPSERVASRSVLEQELADPAQAVEQVILSECWHLATVHASQGCIDPAVGESGDVDVQIRQDRSVARDLV